ncbi:MAG: alpha/beta fold hydrolase [Solirubrobacteraceae bacterium]
MEHETRYAHSGKTHIAYHEVGAGDVDLVFVPSFISNIELGWELPSTARFLTALSRFARLILFDRRGCGASDGPAGAATLEEQLDDIHAVLEATGSRQPALLSLNEGGALALLFAASHPELVRALVLLAPQARLVQGPGYEWAMPAEERRRSQRSVIEHWGEASAANPWMALAGSGEQEHRAMARYQRLAAGPGDAAAALELAGQSDVRDVLSSVQCPTLVLRRAGNAFIDQRHCRYVADHVPGARYVETRRGQNAGEIESFLTGAHPPAPSERVLATVLFTDIVASTERAASLGDAAWRELLRSHDELLLDQVQRHRGRLVKSLGDGALAMFDGPSRALAAAVAIRDGVSALGLQVRAGVHTGECELLGEDVGGIAVHIGARIASLAEPQQVLASRTVRDLTIGSAFALADHGERTLKGVPEPWRLFAVEQLAPAPQS